MKRARTAASIGLVIGLLAATPASGAPISGSPGPHAPGALVCVDFSFQNEAGQTLPNVQANGPGQLIWAKTFLLYQDNGSGQWFWVMDGSNYLQSPWAMFSPPHQGWYDHQTHQRAFQHSFIGLTPGFNYAPVTYLWWTVGNATTGIAGTYAVNPICTIT